MTDAELLAEIEAVAPAPAASKPSVGESRLRGALQGGSLMFGDEAAGGVAALASSAGAPWTRTPGPKALALLYPGVPYPEAAQRWFAENRPDVRGAAAAEAGRVAAPGAYLAERDKQRKANAAAREANPGNYLGAEIATAIPALVATGGAGMKGAALLSALQGAGSSDADSLGGLARDSAVGGGVGALGYGAGALAGKAAKGLIGTANTRLGRALAKETANAAEAKAAAIQSAAGTLGNARAEVNRVVEAIRFLAQEPTLTTAQQAELAALQANPAYPEAVKTLIESLKVRLPAVAQKVAQGELGVANAQAGKTVAEMAAEGISPTTLWQRAIKPRLVRYGPVTVGSYVGNAIGGPLGIGIGALAGAGTRPAVHALRRMVQDPSFQTALWKPIAAAGEAGASAPGRALAMSLGRAGAMAAIPSATGAGEDAADKLGSYLLKSRAERDAEAELARLLAGP